MITAPASLHEGVQINSQDKYGTTPLINAVAIGSSNMETVESLLQKAAQIHLEDRDGNTPVG